MHTDKNIELGSRERVILKEKIYSAEVHSSKIIELANLLQVEFGALISSLHSISGLAPELGAHNVRRSVETARRKLQGAEIGSVAVKAQAFSRDAVVPGGF